MTKEKYYRVVGYKADGYQTFEKSGDFYSLNECKEYTKNILAEAMDETAYCEIYNSNGKYLTMVGDKATYYLSNGKEDRYVSCDTLEEAKDVAVVDCLNIYSYNRKSNQIGKCIYKYKNRRINYDKVFE